MAERGVLTVGEFAGSAAEWDAFVEAQPAGTHAHLHGWRTVIGQVFGHESRYLEARTADGRLAGVLPLVRVRSLLFGHYVVSMPFLNDGGPLGSPDAVAALCGAARAWAGGAKLLELRSRHPLEGTGMAVSHRKITVLLDLPPDGPEALWKSFPPKLRSQVRRPEKAGVQVRFGLDQVDAFHAVFASHMRDLGTPTLPRGFFRALADTFQERVWFGAAYLEDQPVAAGCALVTDNEVEMTWASALKAQKSLAANMLLYWSFIERATQAGSPRFSFGRCSPGGGTHRFKQQWGGRDHPLWWYQVSAGGAAATPAPDQAAYAWGPRIWKHLPLSLANSLGPRIVRAIP